MAFIPDPHKTLMREKAGDPAQPHILHVPDFLTLFNQCKNDLKHVSRPTPMDHSVAETLDTLGVAGFINGQIRALLDQAQNAVPPVPVPQEILNIETIVQRQINVDITHLWRKKLARNYGWGQSQRYLQSLTDWEAMPAAFRGEPPKLSDLKRVTGDRQGRPRFRNRSASVPNRGNTRSGSGKRSVSPGRGRRAK